MRRDRPRAVTVQSSLPKPLLDLPTMSQDAPVAAATPGTPIRRRKLVPRAMLALTLVLGLWIGWTEAPREVGRWYLAAAVEHRVNAAHLRRQRRSEEADRLAQAASVALQKALDWNPDCAEAYLIRAGWRASENRLEEAIEDCERALGLGANPWRVWERRSAINLERKQYRAAVDDQLAIYRAMRSRWWLKDAALVQLNQVAYFRAVGKQDLTLALQEINEVLQKTKRPVNELSYSERLQLMACLDTRGYILFLLDRPKEAINDMDEAATLAEIEVRDYGMRRRQRLYAATDLREFEIREPAQSYNLGVIFYHRSLVLAKLKHKKDAQRDWQMAKDLLGREPDETVF